MQELWHQAYALGAQVVFWPSMMTTPDRDAISLSRLFRYHVVANGSPGAIHDPTGRMVTDLTTATVKANGTAVGPVVTGTMHLDGLCELTVCQSTRLQNSNTVLSLRAHHTAVCVCQASC